MILWMILTVMVALAAVGVTIPLVRRYEQRPSRADALEVLKTQLAEVDTQVAGKLIGDTEAEALRAEIKRRILTESRDTEQPARPIPHAAMPWVALGLVAIVALSATAIYAMMGHPELTSGTPAPEQAASAAPDAKHPMGDISSMIAQLENKLAAQPNDAQGWQMLGWSYMRTGRPADAAKAYGRAVALDPGNVEYVSAQGEAMVQAEGKVSDDAASVFRGALKLDPADPRARYFLAIWRDQQGDHQGAMNDWIALIKSAPPDAPWVAQVRDYAQTRAKELNMDIAGKLPPVPAMPAAAPGPSSDQVAAASQMSDSQRQAMIHAMVDRLADQLKANPKDSGGWVRLMRARMVLGDKDQAAKDYLAARQAFAGTPAAQAALQEAAKSLGVPGA